jgi:hypothetical protein
MLLLYFGLELYTEIWEILKERCNAIERQNVFAEIREKRSLALYGEMKSGK